MRLERAPECGIDHEEQDTSYIFNLFRFLSGDVQIHQDLRNPIFGEKEDGKRQQ
jgi:hypothetical protein